MSLSSAVLEAVSRLLEPCEREVVLGDLVELGETGWRSVFDIVSICLRRQLGLWRNWRPWLAAFGLAIPSSLLLMGLSVSIAQGGQRWINGTVLDGMRVTLGPGSALLLSNVLLLTAWSFTGAFVMGAISRRTVRISVVLSFVPCVFCVARFHIESLSRLCLLLFVIPAAWGLNRGLRFARIRLRTAFFFAAAITLLTIPAWTSKGAWLPNWALSWPAWYLVVSAVRGSHSFKPRPWQTS
ncbi:MAG: hypothetical protein PW789_15145 [Edaphobacter sp.]|uniref:hypothetical protein n=1 Tax=Edaphobacter sp. TaxID=1934404 RepID=UPI00239008F5|nr:hypothetical protein [Edaphobacter sp.]MDE1177914.1 hypothetical protein [Edaphobacter sp.]